MEGDDARIFDSVNEQGGNQMLNPHSLTPFPNAILFNWATVFILAFGNLAALDFQARCMAAKTARIAQIGCLMAGMLGIMVATPFALMGGVARYYYGPDSIHAEFEADTCHRAIDFPTCAQWIPDKQAVLRVLTKVAPQRDRGLDPHRDRGGQYVDVGRRYISHVYCCVPQPLRQSTALPAQAF